MSDGLDVAPPSRPMRPTVIAVFASAQWSDQHRLRVWAKLQDAQQTFVLLTDDATDANVALLRQLSCSNVSCSVMRTVGSERSEQAIAKARDKRDAMMTSLADRVVAFVCPEDKERWFAFMSANRHIPVQMLLP